MIPADWTTSSSLRELVEAFGGRWPLTLAELEEFSAEHWDFRGRAAHAERHQVTAQKFSPAVAALVRRAADELGLSQAQPPVSSTYDHLVILGGRALTCLHRMAYAANLLAGGLSADRIAALGSHRPLADDEKALLDDGAEYEVDALAAGARRYLPGRAVDVLAAPAGPGRDRANTEDTLIHWATSAGLTAGQRVLLVTSPIYVPFQHGDALRVLRPYGCTLETIGFVPAPGLDYQPPRTEHYLQEIRSAIRSMRALAES